MNRWPMLQTGVAMTVVCMAVARGRADDWPAWRGPLGTGVATEKVIPARWSAKEGVRWMIELPDRGNSSPIVVGDRVFVTQAVARTHRRTVMCFDRANGKLLWQSGVTYEQREPSNRHNPYCAASPVSDGERVYAFFGSPGLFCYDLEGKEVWRRDLGKVDSWHGSGSSPILYEGLCILNFGPGSNAALVACDRKTGEVVWKVTPPKTRLLGARQAAPPDHEAGLAGGPILQFRQTKPVPGPDLSGAGMGGDFTGRGGFLGSWSTPLVIRIDEKDPKKDQLVVAHAGQVTAYEPRSGDEIWTCKGLTQQVVSSPAFDGKTLIVTANQVNGGATMLAIEPASGAEVKPVWQTRLRRQCVGSPVIAEGHVFIVSDTGFATCVELSTGQVKWEQRLAGPGVRGGTWSSPLLVGDKLLVVNQSADTFVLSAAPAYQLLAIHSLEPQTTCATPALSRGELFIRTHLALWCVGS